MSDPVEMTPRDLLGQLNGVEQKFAPKMLFVMGRKEILADRPRVSIVGSRKASSEGVKRAKKLARFVAERNGVVVSGLALGIDTAAHTGAIEAGGPTVAVIGTPLNQFYPKENAGLQELIARDHFLISQFPVGYPVQRENFILRNRTMALVSDATVIIEAAEKSGAVSQGWEALRLGRGLFLSKSLAQNESLTWPREMVHHGAEILSDDSVDEFFASLPVRVPPMELDGVKL